MTTTTNKKVVTETHKSEGNDNTLVERESVLVDIRKGLEERFNSLRDQAMSTTNIWERYDIDIALKELKFVYENIVK